MQQTFTSQEVGTVLGIAPKDIQNWATRGLVVGQSEGGKGKPRRYSFFNIMEICVAADLIEVGFGPERAFAQAAAFAHIGSAGSGWVGEGLSLAYRRLPAVPFHYRDGDTLMVIGKDSARVITAAQLTEKLTHDTAIVVNVSRLFTRVCLSLVQMTGNDDFNPFNIMDQLYAEAKAD